MSLDRELSSWKEIAAFLGVSVKTAQLWERDRGLPVSRVPGQRSMVRASTATLEAWKTGATPLPLAAQAGAPKEGALFVPGSAVAARPVRTSHALTRNVLVVVTLAILAGAIMVLGLNRRVVSTVVVENDVLVGRDATGETRWQRSFGRLRTKEYAGGERYLWIGRLGDSERILFIPKPAGFVAASTPLICLDLAGNELWRYYPGKPVSRGEETFDAPYVARQFAILGDKIILTSHHHLYYPNQVSILDSDGALLGEYWHPGHLHVITTGTFEGRPALFLGGVNNLRHAATMVVLDAERIGGAATADQQPAFNGMPAAKEVARLLFPRSCINKDDPYNQVVNILRNDNGFVVDVHEQLNDPHPASIVYHLHPGLTLKSVGLSDQFRTEHNRIADHPFTTVEQGRLQQIERDR